MVVVVIFVVAIVAYFQYVQGLFSATISAICAIMAAIIAVSYHETVIAMLLKGAVANYAQGMILCALFALTYIILRVIADKAVPGNVRYPLMVDKIGSGLMGVVSGLFAAGIVAMAAQSLPFGPSIAGYSRYTVLDRPVTVKNNRGIQEDTINFSEMKETSFDPAKANGMFIPVDDMLVGVVGQLSTGALSNERPLAAIHPDWLTELFGQRAGVQVGTKHVLLNLPSVQMVSLKEVYWVPDKAPQMDAEIKSLRGNDPALPPEPGDPASPLIVVRVSFDTNATDEDGKARVSLASVRLVAFSDSKQQYQNYFPIGTLEDASTVLRNKPDDPLIVAGGKSVDFVFKVPGEDLFKEFNPKVKEAEIKPGVFIEVKRMARMELSGQNVKGPPPFSKDVEVERKDEVAKSKPKRGPTGDSASGGETLAGPIDITGMKVSDKLFSAVNPGVYDAGSPDVTFKGGTATVKDKKFEKLKVNPPEKLTTDDMKAGDFPVTQFYVPDGKKMVQVTGKPVSGKDAWGWVNLGQWELVDSSGNKIKPNGAMARFKRSGGKDQLLAVYEAQNDVSSIDKPDGRPYDVWLLFNVPNGAHIAQLQCDGKTVYEKGIKVP